MSLGLLVFLLEDKFQGGSFRCLTSSEEESSLLRSLASCLESLGGRSKLKLGPLDGVCGLLSLVC